MEELISVQKYASQHRLSIHNVIKKTMSGELKSVVKNENGKEVTYIISSPLQSTPAKASDTPDLQEEEFQIDYKKEYEELHREYLILKGKYEKLLTQSENR